jgi:TetR/AcrR family transcriptional repressor of mexJK operon
MAAHAVAAPDDCRTRLLSAAHAAFLEEGYRASVDRIAARAGVAKQTVYNHFPHKADLFGEVIRQATADLLIALDDDGLNLRERLTRFGIVYRDKALSAAGLGLFRVLAAEAARFPDLAKTVYRTGPARTTARLAAVLQAAIDHGELSGTDADFAATTLLSMLVGAEHTRFLFSGEQPSRTNPMHAGRIVDCFLRAFAPENPFPAAKRNTP